MARVFVQASIIFAYFSLLEYIVHRFAMHRPMFGRFWWWRDHAVEHHGRGRNDINVDLNPLTVCILASPLLVLCVFFKASFALMLLGSAIAYALAWTVLHRAHHDLGCKWLFKWSFYRWLRQYHHAHHHNPTTNFGLIFPFTDLLFGTRSKSDQVQGDSAP